MNIFPFSPKVMPFAGMVCGFDPIPVVGTGGGTKMTGQLQIT
jgi:hypothetical protein